jgi:hypothetical protein
MTPSKILTLVPLIGLISLFSLSFISKDKSKAASYNGNNSKGFAVVELFTSEGCSSCPPADELVAKIQKENIDMPVYILAYHVDYWNRLGWKDRFSNAAFSQRQRRYADWLNLSSVYTPQAVVNGSKEFVGSEEGALRNAIKSSLQKTSDAQLTLKVVKSGQRKVTVQYHTEGETTNTSLLLALVQKSAVSKVQRGENSGRTLFHVQIVRNLQTINLVGIGNGSATVDLPEGEDKKDVEEVIAFLQKNDNGEIVAAGKSVLEAEMPMSKEIGPATK